MRRVIRRHKGERGSVLIELAMVVLPLMLIVMGMVEIGGAWKDKSSAVQASRQGARVITSASIATQDYADREALRAVLAGVPQGTSGAAQVQIRKVIIFDLSVGMAGCENDGESSPKDITSLPAAPKNTNAGCNVYLAGNAGTGEPSLDLAEINAATWDGSGSAWDSAFRARNRNNSINNATEVGVYVEMYRPWITGFFPGDGTLVSGFTVMRIEPPGI
ncbi:MAG: pilus assembly protein [Acidimicrobiales bacterium]|nr:pilus assembly protein [Acidimicrobiales bacterium]